MTATVVKVMHAGETSFEFSPDRQRLLVIAHADSGDVVLDLTRSAAFDLAEKVMARAQGLAEPVVPKQPSSRSMPPMVDSPAPWLPNRRDGWRT